MCEASAYIVKQDKEQLVMDFVDLVEPEGDNAWRLVALFGAQKVVKGQIKRMNLVDHKILFEAQED